LLNALACQREATGQFATVFLAALNEPTMTLTYTNAGHNPPVLLRAGGERQLLDTGGLLVGISATATYEEATLDLRPGDRLILYTDGVTEAARADGEMFGEDRLYAALAGLPASLDAPGS
jgi:sigma-B regulation protein RsbU (phosphoserine phosphatase)